MLRNGRNVRIYVRNKDRYNIETKKREFLFVEVADFAGTTIGELKENVRRQCRNSVKIDALYLNNQPLANDRSVAHYNLEDETILETTSNPFWVSCLYIKAAEIKQLQQGHPEDEDVQKWTQKSLPKKFTLIGLLLNSKNEYRGQPPHFPTLDDFVLYLEQLNKKGATMHPDYTQKDMRAFEREFSADFVGRYDDPLATFLDHYAVHLGYLDPDEIDPNQRPVQRPVVPQVVRPGGRGVAGQAGRPAAAGRKKEQRHCEDCEEAVAELYCSDCPGGIALCRPCSAVLHAGATRRRHTLQDIAQAPKISKHYVPRAFLAPFAIVVAMYSALRDGRLSLTEEEIKKKAQSLTDTDLQDKQTGKYVGGFDCMENVLMMKGFVQKEAARVPTYALTESGQVLGERLFTFYTAFYKFSEACRLPKVTNSFRSSVIGNRHLCLLIDDKERDKERLLRFATEKQISAQVRLLPAGDYIWILTPPMVDPHVVYTGRDYDNEQVLPFVVERKSWEDLGNSAHTTRFQRQVNSMLGSGIKNCFYLVEGSVSGTKYRPTHQQHDFLKSLMEKLTTEHGFYVNYTTSWMKSAQWLLWFSGLIMEGLRMGHHHDDRLSYTEYMSRVARQHGAAVARASFRNAQKLTHRWTAQLFIDHIFRDSLRERTMLSTVEEDLRVNTGNKHMLIIENLQEYNKRRQSVLNKCCETVHNNPGQAREIVEDKIGAVLHNMVHYDIPSYWQLYIQVIVGVYIVRTESDQERDRIQQRFQAGPQDPPPPDNIRNKRTPGEPKRARKKPSKTPAATATVVSDHADERHRTPNWTPRAALETADTSLNKQDQFRRRAQIHTIGSFDGSGDLNVADHGKDFLHNRLGHVDNRDGDKGLNKRNHFRRKAQIHTIDSINKTADVNSVQEKGGYVHDRLADFGNMDHDENMNRKTVEGKQALQPFSGKGFCLGTAADDEMEDYMGRGSCTPAVLPGGTGDTNSGKGTVDRGRSAAAAGLGMAEDEFDNKFDSVALDAEDFIDSQNEEDVLNEILNRSAAEVQKTSNEDQMLKLALELSKTETNVGKTLVDKEEELLQKVMEQSKHEVHSRRNATEHVQRPHKLGRGHPEINLQIEEENDMVKDQAVINHVEDDEDEMIKRAIEISKKTLMTVKNGVRLMADLESLPEDEQLKQALEISVTENQISGGNLRKTSDHTVNDKSVKRAVKRKISGDEILDSSHDGSAIVEVDEEKTGMSGEEKLRKAVEHREQAGLGSRDTEEDEELIEALKRSMVEHSPQKKTRKSYDKDVALAIERSKKDNDGRLEKENENSDEMLKLTKGRSMTDHSPRKRARLSTKNTDERTRVIAAAKCDSVAAGVGNIDDSQQVLVESQSQNLDINSNSLSEVKSNASNDDIECDNIHQTAGKDIAEYSETNDLESKKNRNLHISSPQSTISSEPAAMLSQSTDQLYSKYSNEQEDIASDEDANEDFDEADLVPPSPENLSQSLTSSSENKRTSLSFICSNKKLKLGQLEENPSNSKENEHDVEKIKRSKNQGFDFKSCLFGTSDDSDNESGDESDGDIFEDKDDTMDVKIGSENIKKYIVMNEKGDNDTAHLREKPDTRNCQKEENSNRSKDLIETDEYETVDLFNELQDIEYMYEDDDNDIDYQPGTQEIDTVEDSEDVEEENEEEIPDLSDEILPVIRGPRSKLYKELRAKEKKLLQQKMFRNVLKDDINKAKEKTAVKEIETVGKDKIYDEDRELARILQELGQEREMVSQEQTVLNDEDFAKRLQAELNKTLNISNAKTDVESSVDLDEVQTKNDEEYARRLQEELDNSVMPETLGPSKHGCPNSGDLGRDLAEGSQALIRELQRRELEKIEKLNKSMEKDKHFAKELQNLDAGTAVTPKKGDVSPRQPSFKRHVAEQKLGREQTLAQEYRKQQIEKYRGGQETGPVGSGGDIVAAATTVDLTQSEDDLRIDQTPDLEDHLFRQGNAYNQFSQREAGINQSQATVGSYMSQPNQSQSTVGSQITQHNQSQSSVGSHMTQSGQSQRSNITCGNCGEKGHTRKFVHCPKYHTAEETARREEKSREDRRKRELRAVQEELKEQINAQKDERKKQEIQNMQAVVMSAETEFQTTMNRLRNIIQQVEQLSGPDSEISGDRQKNSRKKKRK